MRSGVLNKVKRVVVKVGTKLLVNERGRLDPARINQIVEEIAGIHRSGREIILVTSGAIVAGLESLGLQKRPKNLPYLQAAAAIGQGQLMHFYQSAFSRCDVLIAQILLTGEDLKERRRHLNAKNTFEALLDQKVIPIVNENDTVAVDEIKFGDNDQLSALVANLVQADLLIILTDQDGFLKDGQVVPMVFEIDKELEMYVHRSKDWKGVGGMQSKLDAARIVMRSGELMMIANGLKKGTLEKIFHDAPVGTLFIPKGKKMPGRKRWIAHFVKPQGDLVLDEGAVMAIRDKRKSLLAPGIIEIRGSFRVGDTVRLIDRKDQEIARGLVNYPDEDLKKAIGKTKEERLKILEVIHRDNLVIL